MNESDRKNIAFIDGQNLYMGTAKREVDPWRIDLQRFRVYLEQKYHVVKAYYFWGMFKKSIKIYMKKSNKLDSFLFFESIIRQ